MNTKAALLNMALSADKLKNVLSEETLAGLISEEKSDILTVKVFPIVEEIMSSYLVLLGGILVKRGVIENTDATEKKLDTKINRK